MPLHTPSLAAAAAVIALLLALSVWLASWRPRRDALPATGLGLLFDPFLLLGLKALWFILFLHFGRSMVTKATLSFEGYAGGAEHRRRRRKAQKRSLGADILPTC
jgi:hypothetical protein